MSVASDDDAIPRRLKEGDIETFIEYSDYPGDGSHYRAMPKLEGRSNWEVWSPELRNAARFERSHELLTGRFKRPERPAETVDDDTWNTYVKVKILWSHLNDNLLAGIHSSCSSHISQLLAGEQDAVKAYNTLQEHFQEKGAFRAMMLIREIQSNTLDKYKSIEDYATSFMALERRAQGLDLGWSEELTQVVFMANLGRYGRQWQPETVGRLLGHSKIYGSTNSSTR